MDNLITNSGTRLWIIEDAGYPHLNRYYVGHIVIKRIMVADKECRLLLHSRFFRRGDSEYLLRDFKPGSYIEAHYGVCGDPKRYDPMSVIASFYNLRKRRWWTGALGVLSPNNLGAVDEWMEVWTDKWTIK